MKSGKIVLQKKEIEYFIIKKITFRNIRIKIEETGRVKIFSPILVSDSYLKKILLSKANWLLRKIKLVSEIKEIEVPNNLSAKQAKELARGIISKRVLEINKFYNFSFCEIFLRNQKTRWGSCSTKKNLNFNYKIAFLPDYLRDYIITHEICHLKEMNHSSDFWDLVKKTVPDCLSCRRELKKWRSN